MRLVVDGSPPARVDRALLKAVARGYRWLEELLEGRVRSVAELAEREGVSGSYVWRMVRLGFLSPGNVER